MSNRKLKDSSKNHNILRDAVKKVYARPISENYKIILKKLKTEINIYMN
jgi:hypothetical protein